MADIKLESVADFIPESLTDLLRNQQVTRAGDGAPIDDGDEAPDDGPSTDDEAWFCRWDPWFSPL
jgi:hypothetical protein